MLERTDGGVWMDDVKRCESVARMVAIDCMTALKLDAVNDFMTRDRIIAAISPRINSALSEVADEDIYRRAMESIAKQFIHPRITALQLAKTQLGLSDDTT